MHSWVFVALTLVLTAVLFSLAGLLNGVFAKTFDDISLVPTFVLTPLTYLGGVFYSLTLLPPFWQGLSHLNPIVYMISGFQALVPVVQALEATGEINGKLIWSNTGYLINWYLTEMKQLLGEATVESLRHALFFEKTLTTGEDNPLWRTVVLRDGLLVRRTCCQRYRLPDVQQCGDCTLK